MIQGETACMLDTMLCTTLICLCVGTYYTESSRTSDECIHAMQKVGGGAPLLLYAGIAEMVWDGIVALFIVERRVRLGQSDVAPE